MKTPVMLGWINPEKLLRVREALHRPMAEAETATLYSLPAVDRVPLHTLLEIPMPGEPVSVPQAALLYESELHPGMFVDSNGHYFRVAFINMELNCPHCGHQHIDKVEPGWDNPPHKTHLCHNCERLWRPAEVATYGVERIRTAS